MLSFRKVSLFVSLVVLAAAILGCQLQQSTPVVEPVTVVAEEAPDHASETLEALLSADPPQRNLDDMARRMLALDVQPLSPSQSKQGDVESFWYRSGDGVHVQTTARLAYQSDILNFWVEDGVRASKKSIDETTETLEQGIIPTTQDYFGSNSASASTNNSRINVLNLSNIEGALGYFTGSDQYSAKITPHSNERRILYMNVGRVSIGSEEYYEVLAHEFQHMVHNSTDSNESSWLDEGLAELSAHVNGYENRGTIAGFVALPDTQLNDWAIETAHYGAGFLFSAYFLDRYGDDAIKAVIANEQNGFSGFSEVLAQVDAKNDINQFFADWVVTNYVEGIGAAAAPYQYSTLEVGRIAPVETVDSFPTKIMGDVHQFAADYIKVEADKPVAVSVKGSQKVQLMDGNPYSGDYFIATYPADRSDMTLTRSFDLSNSNGVTPTLSFQTWYRIEKGWDYGYVLASEDGESWTMLNSIYMTTANPNGNNYGTGLTGKSGVNADDSIWAENLIDLSPYAGKQIQLRFEYITDDAVVEDGWAIDDISIEAIDYFENFEDGLGGWEAAGFVRHTNILPQTYIVQAIYASKSGVTVQPFEFDADQNAQLTLDLNQNQSEAVIVISGNTPLTTKRAGYEIEFSAE